MQGPATSGRWRRRLSEFAAGGVGPVTLSVGVATFGDGTDPERRRPAQPGRPRTYAASAPAATAPPARRGLTRAGHSLGFPRACTRASPVARRPGRRGRGRGSQRPVGGCRRPAAPVVLLVLDEFPVDDLVGPDGRIDEARFPNFVGWPPRPPGSAAGVPSTTPPPRRCRRSSTRSFRVPVPAPASPATRRTSSRCSTVGTASSPPSRSRRSARRASAATPAQMRARGAHAPARVDRRPGCAAGSPRKRVRPDPDQQHALSAPRAVDPPALGALGAAHRHRRGGRSTAHRLR